MKPARTRRALLWSALLAAAVVWAAAGPARAIPVYSNFGPGDSFGTSAVGLNAVQRDVAVSFDVGASAVPFLLDTIEVPLQGSGGGDGIAVRLATDNAGEPDQILETATLFIFGTTSIHTASFSGTTLIDTPGTYWVWLRLDSGSGASWFINDQGVLGSWASSTDGGSSWSVSSGVTEPAFRVNAVPEPGTASLLACGLVGLVMMRRRSS